MDMGNWKIRDSEPHKRHRPLRTADVPVGPRMHRQRTDHRPSFLPYPGQGASLNPPPSGPPTSPSARQCSAKEPTSPPHPAPPPLPKSVNPSIRSQKSHHPSHPPSTTLKERGRPAHNSRRITTQLLPSSIKARLGNQRNTNRTTTASWFSNPPDPTGG